MKARLLQACLAHGVALPWVLLQDLLQKRLARRVRIANMIIFSRGVRANTAAAVAPVPAVQVARIDDHQSTLFRRLCDRFPHAGFEQRLQQENRQCYVAVRNDSIAGFAWVASTTLYIDEIACHYPVSEREIFIYDCFVDRDYRGAGIYPLMLDTVLLDHGGRCPAPERACIAALSVNRASIRGIRKAGFVEHKRVRYLEWGQRRHWWGLSAPAIPSTD